MEKAFLSTEEAAAYLGVSVAAFRMAQCRGHLVPTGRLGRRLLWTVDDLHRQVRAHAATIDVRSVAFESALEKTDAEKRNADGSPGRHPGREELDFAGAR